MFDVHMKNSGSFRDFTLKNIIRLSFRGVILISGINIVMASLRVLFCVVCRDPDSSPRLKAWPLSIRSFRFKHVRICRNFNFMECFEVIILKKWYQQIRYGEYKQKLRYDK